MSITRITPAATSLAAIAAFGVLAAGSADAHVRVTPERADIGGYATLTFKVPNESAKASTTKVVVDLPADYPFGYVSYLPVAGWQAHVDMKKLDKPMTTSHGERLTEVPSRITWTSDASSAIKPGQFQQFTVSAGAMPSKPTTLTFPAHQTYSDGSVVDWTQKQQGNAEPEHPAPSLTVAKPEASQGSLTTALQQSQAAAEASRQHDDTTARWLGVTGIVVGLGGFLAAIWAATRRARR